MHNSNKWSNDPSLEKFAAVHAVFKCNVSKCKHSYIFLYPTNKSCLETWPFFLPMFSHFSKTFPDLEKGMPVSNYFFQHFHDHGGKEPHVNSPRPLRFTALQLTTA